MLPRGGGNLAMRQTVGAALVIDHSKHLNRVLSIDPENRRAVVEPGLVLDHLNAKLKPLGLWYPVDVSTSAQATLGGMAGNNSCGSRSIAYGNMVHNVAGIEMLLADGRIENSARKARAAMRRLVNVFAPFAIASRDEIAVRFPKAVAPRGRLQPGYFRAARSVALQQRRAESRAPLGRFRRHTRRFSIAGAESLAAARASRAWRGEFPDVPSGHGIDPTHRHAGPNGGGAGRSHDDRPRAKTPHSAP